MIVRGIVSESGDPPFSRAWIDKKEDTPVLHVSFLFFAFIATASMFPLGDDRRRGSGVVRT